MDKLTYQFDSTSITAFRNGKKIWRAKVKNPMEGLNSKPRTGTCPKDHFMRTQMEYNGFNQNTNQP